MRFYFFITGLLICLIASNSTIIQAGKHKHKVRKSAVLFASGLPLYQPNMYHGPLAVEDTRLPRAPSSYLQVSRHQILDSIPYLYLKRHSENFTCGRFTDLVGRILNQANKYPLQTPSIISEIDRVTTRKLDDACIQYFRQRRNLMHLRILKAIKSLVSLIQEKPNDDSDLEDYNDGYHAIDKAQSLLHIDESSDHSDSQT